MFYFWFLKRSRRHIFHLRTQIHKQTHIIFIRLPFMCFQLNGPQCGSAMRIKCCLYLTWLDYGARKRHKTMPAFEESYGRVDEFFFISKRYDIWYCSWTWTMKKMQRFFLLFSFPKEKQPKRLKHQWTMGRKLNERTLHGHVMFCAGKRASVSSRLLLSAVCVCVLKHWE